MLLTDIETVLTTGDIAQKTGIFQQYMEDKIPVLISLGIKVVLALLVFYVGSRMIGWVRRIARKSMERANSDAGVMQFADSAIKFGSYILLIIIIISMFGVESTSIAAAVASCGMALSLALQGSLSNLAGGILILILKPFVVGDYIIEDANKNEGTVKEIQIFYTKLATVDNKTIVIPNGALANNSLTNVTHSDFRQLDLRVGISYESDLRKAKQILVQILDTDIDIEQEKDKNVFVDDLGDSAVILGFRAWVPTNKFLTVKWRLLEKIKLTFDEQGIEIPYNQITVHMGK